MAAFSIGEISHDGDDEPQRFADGPTVIYFNQGNLESKHPLASQSSQVAIVQGFIPVEEMQISRLDLKETPNLRIKVELLNLVPRVNGPKQTINS